jgi:hypothetical protein
MLYLSEWLLCILSNLCTFQYYLKDALVEHECIFNYFPEYFYNSRQCSSELHLYLLQLQIDIVFLLEEIFSAHAKRAYFTSRNLFIGRWIYIARTQASTLIYCNLFSSHLKKKFFSKSSIFVEIFLRLRNCRHKGNHSEDKMGEIVTLEVFDLVAYCMRAS